MEGRDYLIILVVTLVSLDSAVSIVCPDGMKKYIHPDGTEDCIFCTDCPRGYVKKENCSVQKDTVCEKCHKQFYYVDDEPHCVPCTVCEPGKKLVKNCSQFEDSMCKQCPGGTFSFNNDSLDCKACGRCEGKLIDQECTPSTDIVCKEHSHLTATWDRILFIVAVVVEVFLGLILFSCSRRKLKLGDRNKQNDDLEGGNLLQDKDEGLGQPSKQDKAEQNEISEVEAKERAAREAARKALDEFKEKMKNRVRELSILSKGEQFKTLGLSVGELIIDSSQETTFAIESEMLEGVVNPNKPQIESKERDNLSEATHLPARNKHSKEDHAQMPETVKDEGQTSKELTDFHSKQPASSQQKELCETGESNKSAVDQVSATNKQPERKNQKQNEMKHLKQEENTVRLTSTDKQQSTTSGSITGKTENEISEKKKNEGEKQNMESRSWFKKSPKKENYLGDIKIVSERDKKLFFKETQIERFFGIFVGSKYIMTSLHSLEKTLGPKIRADKNIVIRLKVNPCVKEDDNIQTYSVKSVPVYKNEPLDVALLEILEPSPSPFASVNLSKHSAYEASEIVTFQDNMVLPIRVLTGQDDRKKAFDKFYRKKSAKVKSEPDTPKTIHEQSHAKHDDVGTNDNMGEGKGADVNSRRNLQDFDSSTESGNARPGESEINNASKVFWKSKGYVCAGLPCFIFDEKKNMYHLVCISNFPKFYTSLSKVDQKEFRKDIKIHYGTSMVALHKDMFDNNKMLCEELFVDLSCKV